MSRRRETRASGFGEILDRAMLARTQAEADDCFEAIVAFLTPHHASKTREQVETLARDNIAYWAAHDRTRRGEIEAFYKCEDPLFGSVAECGMPTPEEAFNAGVRLASCTTIEQRREVARRIRDERKVVRALDDSALYGDDLARFTSIKGPTT